MSVGLAAALLAGTVISLVFGLRERHARLRAEQAEELARQAEGRAVEAQQALHNRLEAEQAGVATAVVDLLQHQDPKAHEAALKALSAMRPAIKTHPKLIEILEKHTLQPQRTALALTLAYVISDKDPASVKRLVRVLLESLDPKALDSDREGDNEDKINQALGKIGQLAVDECNKKLEEILKERDTTASIQYRKKLYTTLAKLGETCKSQSNYDKLNDLRLMEGRKPYISKDIYSAVNDAMKKMEP